ncbi:MAG: hypothetical protein GY849_24030 [Deltaproteobacteria bacterium]|nr:hypothetical protein [Deltaproteobacteria bacterium]
MIVKKTYKTTDEFYKAVEKLIEMLHESEFDSVARKLDKLLHSAWTTGSELIGELMLFFETINLNLPKEAKKLKDNCYYFAKHHRKILGLD